MKKNFNKIPKTIELKAKKLSSDELVVISTKTISIEDIRNHKYDHIGISEQNGKINFPNSILPNEKQGKYSNWNKNGREIKRKDLPKETYYNYVEAPNWGDSYNGTHTVVLPGERYPIEFIPPRLTEIKIELLETEKSGTNYLIRFTFSEVLNRLSNEFNNRLLFCVNIMQENFGNCDIVISGISIEDYLKTHIISWEIFPPGNKEDFINRLFKGRIYTQQEKQTSEDRYDFFTRLQPEELIIGTNGFQRYFGAKLKEDLVLFENTDYGNALYIMYKNWEELSKKSRIELLSGRFGTDFDRIIHTGNWKDKVKEIIKDKK